MRIALAGSSGLIGTALTAALHRSGHDVLRLVRRPARNPSEVQWEPEDGGVPSGAFDSVDAVVNLCGVGIAQRLWSGQFRQELRDSRLVPTEAITDAVNRCGVDILINASATGFYGDTGTRQVDETAGAGSGFLAGLCSDWEGTAAQATSARVVFLRTAPVFAPSGGLLARLRPLFRLGMGGRLGNGRQFFPWITLLDEVRAIEFLLAHPVAGPVNLSGPQPVTNAEFTRALATAVHRPAIAWVPAPILSLVGGDLAREMLLAGQNVIPRVLLDNGFEFSHPTIASACEYANA